MKRKFALLLAAALCLTALAGCAPAQETIEKITALDPEERTEQQWADLVEAYVKEEDEANAGRAANDALGWFPSSQDLEDLAREHRLPAPQPQKAPGEYSGSLRLHFDGDVAGHGQLYVVVDREEDYIPDLEPDLSVVDDGLEILDLPSEHGMSVDLYLPGTHYVRAVVVQDNEEASEVFSGTYTLTGADLSGFDFDQPAGEYTAPMTLGFKGGQGEIYYTTDGSDPLWLGAAGAVLSVNGTTKAENGVIALPIGVTSISARCIAPNGLVSPLIQGDFTVSMVFDSASSHVGEDSKYEYVGTEWGGVIRYDKNTGEHENLLDRKTKRLAVFSYIAEGNSNSYDPAMPPEAILQMSKPKPVTTIYALDNIGTLHNAMDINGELTDWNYAGGYDDLRAVGPGWLIYPIETTGSWDYYSTVTNKYYVNSVNWVGNGTRVGTEELAKQATLMTAQYAAWTGRDPDNYENTCIVLCDTATGGNIRYLAGEDQYIALDAMTDHLILYRKYTSDGLRNMVCDLNDGSVRENRYLTNGENVLGYTTSHAYIQLDGGGYTHIDIDYSQL